LIIILIKLIINEGKFSNVEHFGQCRSFAKDPKKTKLEKS